MTSVAVLVAMVKLVVRMVQQNEANQMNFSKLLLNLPAYSPTDPVQTFRCISRRRSTGESSWESNSGRRTELRAPPIVGERADLRATVL